MKKLLKKLGQDNKYLPNNLLAEQIQVQFVDPHVKVLLNVYLSEHKIIYQLLDHR